MVILENKKSASEKIKRESKNSKKNVIFLKKKKQKLQVKPEI